MLHLHPEKHSMILVNKTTKEAIIDIFLLSERLGPSNGEISDQSAKLISNQKKSYINEAVKKNVVLPNLEKLIFLVSIPIPINPRII